jgi:UPF0755 protein
LKKLLVIVALVVIAGGIWIAWGIRAPYRGYPASALVTIPPRSNARSAAGILVSHGVLRNEAPFLALYILGRPQGRTLKAGEYLFDHALSARDVYWRLVRGDVYYHLVMIPEGSDRFDMARTFQEKLGLKADDFLNATAQSELIRDLDPNATTLEGYLFPDTYRFPASTTAASAAETMVERFRHVMSSKLAQIPSGSSLHDLLTLASLVEKETPDAPERLKIAGVFTRRLQRGMTLDCDPTVRYAARLTAPPSVAMDPAPTPITASEINSPSPYNTYRHAGLPPGPICSPGAASIEAALHPSDGDSLYFVSNLHGGHIFANTLDEHNRNVARYRRQLSTSADHANDTPAEPRR